MEMAPGNRGLVVPVPPRWREAPKSAPRRIGGWDTASASVCLTLSSPRRNAAIVDQVVSESGTDS